MKRFYRDVAVEEAGNSWRVTLDGRPIKTQLGDQQRVPTKALAEALAAEWRDQGDEIDTRRFIARDMADYAIDVVRPDRSGVIDKLLAFGETDTLCYRADPEEPLYRRQLEVWEPLLTALEEREGVKLERVSGIVHRPQSVGSLAKLRARLESLDDFTLAALQTLTSLAASLCVGLAVLEEGADPESLWDAANLEELWQIELWGHDEEAAARFEKRSGEFLSAARFARLVES